MKTKEITKPQLRFSIRLTNIFLFVMLTIYPLWLIGDYQTILQSKFNAFIILTGLYLTLMLLYGIKMLISRKITFPNAKQLWNTTSTVQRIIILFWFFCLLSSVISVYGSKTLIGLGRFEGLICITLYCAIFLCASAFARPGKRLIYAFGASMTIVCIIAAIQLSGGNPFFLYPYDLNYFDANKAYSGAYLSTTGNTDLLASLLCVSIPAFALSIMMLKDKIRYILFIPLVLCLYVLLKEDVSSGIVCIAAGALLMIPVVAKVSAKVRRLLWSGVVAAIFSGIILIYFFGGNFNGSIYEFSEILHGRSEDFFGSGRIFIWKETLKLVPDHLWFGGGPDTLIVRIGAYFERYDETTNNTIQAVIDSAHNEYLNILVNEGLFALLTYLGALIVSFVSWIKYALKSNAVAISGGAVLCYCIQAFFGISCCITAPFLWLSLALLDNSIRKEIVRSKGIS